MSAFADSFQHITNYPPTSWHERLYGDLVDGKRYDTIDPPTGLGKASVIPIWFVARRVVYWKGKQ
jgi:CRISPR-associated endonuclease/helicase Cas3